MNDLKTEFESATGGLLIDTDRLAARAVRRGTRLKWRHRAAVGAGVAAMVIVPVGIAAAISDLHEPVLRQEAPVLAQRDEQVPLTGRATAAALRELVGERVPSAMSGFEGQDTSTVTPEVVGTYARLRVQRTGDRAGTPVMVNVQGGWHEADLSCSDYAGKPACRVSTHGAWQVLSFEQPDGTALARHVYAVDAARHLRVAVSSTNGEDFEKVGPDHRAPRALVDEPPLTLAQLTEIATWEGWGPTIGKGYADMGAALTPYKDHNEES